MIAIEHLQALTELLTEQTIHVQQLLEKLRQEHSVLSSGETERLDQIVTEKKSLILLIDSSMEGVNRLLSEQGFTANKAGLDSLLQTLPDSTPLHRQWEKLQHFVAACQEKSDINSGIVTLKQRHVRQAIDILKGNPSNENIYDKQGEVGSGSTLNSFTKA